MDYVYACRSSRRFRTINILLTKTIGDKKMTTKVSKSAVKKEAINVLTNEMLSPFAVLNAINKSRKDPAVMELLNQYGITKKLELSDLCTLYDYSDRNVFCKLRKINNKKDIEFCEYKQIKIGSAFYEYVPIKFTIREFFYSLESALKIQKENEKTAQMYSDLFESTEKKAAKKAADLSSKAAKKAAKKAADLSSKVAAKAKELKEKFADLPDNMIMQLAEEFFKAA